MIEEMDGPEGLVNALFSDPEVSLNFWVVGFIVPHYKAFSFVRIYLKFSNFVFDQFLICIFQNGIIGTTKELE